MPPPNKLSTDAELRAESGRRLRAARQAIGLTQMQVCERTGLDQTYLSSLETGRRVPNWTLLWCLVEAGYPLNQLFLELAEKKST